MLCKNSSSTRSYLKLIGVANLPPLTSPFDPGYDPGTLESHFEQSSHLISILKVSMACWMVANEDATRRKVAAAGRHSVPTVTGGGPFEIAVAQRRLGDYLDLCAEIGFTRIECGEGFTDMPLGAGEVLAMANKRGLDVQFELGKKHTGAFGSGTVDQLIAQGKRWLDAGALDLVVEARESAKVSDSLTTTAISTAHSRTASPASLASIKSAMRRRLSPASLPFWITLGLTCGFAM